MHKLITTAEFTSRYRELPTAIKNKLKKQERLFITNPFYPSLHTEKLQPKDKQYWSFRVDRSYRVLFRFSESNEVILITVGTHDWIYRLLR